MHEFELYYTLLYLLAGIILSAPFLYHGSKHPDFIVPTFSRILVIASLIYVAFALFAGTRSNFLLELLGLAIFGGILWLTAHHHRNWLVFGWFLHPLWDLCFHTIGGINLFPALQHLANHSPPGWYATVCLSFDIMIGLFLIKQLHPNSYDHSLPKL